MSAGGRRQPAGRRPPLTSPAARLFVIAVLVNGVYDAVRLAISYRVLALGGDAFAIGLTTASFAVLPMLLALRFGRVVDRRGSWGVLTIGAVVSAGAVAAAAVSPGVALLAGATALTGIGQMMTLIGAQGMVMELSDRTRHVNGFAMFTLAVSLGQTIGTPLLGLLLESGRVDGGVVETGPALLVMAGVIFVALPLTLSLPRRTSPTGGAAARGATSIPDLLRRDGMAPSIYASLIVVSGFDLITAYLPLVAESAGLSALTVSLLVATRSLFAMISRAAMPWVLRRVAQRRILVLAPVVTTPAVLVLGLSGDALVLWVALAVIGFFWGLNQPVTMNWVTAAAPSGDRAAALSLRIAGNRAAQVLIPVTAGAIAGAAGPGSVFFLSGVLTAVSAASTTTSLRRHPFADLELDREP